MRWAALWLRTLLGGSARDTLSSDADYAAAEARHREQQARLELLEREAEAVGGRVT